ncbi:MAG: ArsR/SmtB family transcription factor [Acidimicrobiales bacterium]
MPEPPGAGVAGEGGAGVADEGGPGPPVGPDPVFAALADPTRRRLIDQLSATGPQTATELAGDYPVSRQAVTKHLGQLSAAGLLRSERHGRQVLYDVVPGRLAEASDWLDSVGRRWDTRLEALRRSVAGDAAPGPSGQGDP